MSEDHDKSKKNVIVFGETGVGKSSVINMLLGRQAAIVSDAAFGCTFDYQAYPHGDYVFYDTAGLNEGSKGTSDFTESIGQLIKLLKLLTKDGIHLLVCVIKKGRINKSIEDNYEIFVKSICDESVPMILVITNCEQEEEMGLWWEANRKHFIEDYHMKVKDSVSVCASTGDGLKKLYADDMKRLFGESRARLWRSIEDNSLPLEGGWRMATWYDWLANILKKAWNLFCSFFGLGDWRLSFWPKLMMMFVDYGVDKDKAIKMADEIYGDVA